MGTISLEQALRNAIEGEDCANRYYTLLAESTDDPEARKFLGEMAREEAAHKKQIEAMASTVTDKQLPDLPDDNVELVETREEWAHADNIDFDSAVGIALEAEEFAALYYDAVASSCGDPKMKNAFEMIARTEEKHAAHLRALQK